VEIGERTENQPFGSGRVNKSGKRKEREEEIYREGEEELKGRGDGTMCLAS